LATEYKFSQLDHLISVITLEELDEIFLMLNLT